MIEERMKKLLETEDVSIWNGCNVYQGLQIIAKYIDPLQIPLVVATKKDILYSVDIKRIIEAGITEESVLIECNDAWSIGSYGLDPIIYTNILLKRWFEIVK